MNRTLVIILFSLKNRGSGSTLFKQIFHSVEENLEIPQLLDGSVFSSRLLLSFYRYVRMLCLGSESKISRDEIQFYLTVLETAFCATKRTARRLE